MMEPANVRELFLETVMRTVLCRLRLPAFHASALEKQGQAVLLVGSKGAGKSTLAAALLRAGWSLLADDLVRVRCDESYWVALPGMRRSKLRPDSMRALGYSAEGARLRWTGRLPPGSEHLVEEKLLVSSSGSPETTAPVPIVAVLSLQPRDTSLRQPRFSELRGAPAVLHLAEHLIRDPLPPHGTPPSTGRMLGDLVRQARVCHLQMPDDLEALQHAAESLEHNLLFTAAAHG